jgi:BirA family biotin operon repressor/biotin-[acetyl-CoA-carboxylase] ligase
MTQSVLRRLAHYLSDVETRSGEAIGNELGCSRTAVWKHVQALRNLGIEIDAVAGHGYRLKEPLELLDRSVILDGMDPALRERLNSLVIGDSMDSTNSAVQRLAEVEQHGAAVFAEHQASGRGRRGRSWHSPFGKNLYLSLGWCFDKSMSELGCVSLVAAIAVAQALNRVGLEGHYVKWPNDLLLDGSKLAGCLVEVQGDTQGPCHAVFGVGLNVHMGSKKDVQVIDQPWTDVHSHVPGCSRNALAAQLLDQLVAALQRFESSGFEPFKPLWKKLDGLEGKSVMVEAQGSELCGIGAGIDESGALLLKTAHGVDRLYSGEVSVRAV